MNRKRLLMIAAVFLFTEFLLQAWQGKMSGAGKLRVSQTKWFDIIYSEESEVTASILYENADAVLSKLQEDYGYEWTCDRFPVVITRTVEQFNAYFSYYPYNHIVLFDTAEIPDLAVFSQTVLSVFTHELTHAFTYNLKNTTYRILARLFGDAFAVHYLTVTSGMAEGATVSYESSNGEGRLNDPYALQMVRQAKIEGQFPSYSDVKGASDAYPGGSFYYFNGAFAAYLQKTYGMNKYGEFWFRCVNLKNISAGRAFKKTFGIKLDKAWEQFLDSYSVPVLASTDPVKDGYARDFFNQERQGPSIKNNAGSRYSNLRACQKGLVYLDDSCNTVFFADTSSKKPVPRKLFSQDNIDYLNVSADGRYVSIGYYNVNSANIQHCAALYDVQKRKYLKVQGNNIVNPIVVCSGSEYYFVWQKYENLVYSICSKKIEENKAVSIYSDYQVISFEANTVPSGFIDTGAGDGSVAFIKKTGLAYSICVLNSELSAYDQYEFPFEDVRIHSISSAQDDDGNIELYFSWATKNTLPRLGRLSLASKEFELSAQNISGGVYYPVYNNGTLFYTGEFYRQNRLFCSSLEKQNLESYTALFQTVSLKDDSPEELSAGAFDIASVQIPYKPFSALSYTFEGILLPLPSVSSRDFTSTGGSRTFDMEWGLTYLTSLPWDAGALQISGGYGTQTKSGGFGIQYSGGTDTSLFNYTIDASMEVDALGFKQTHGAVDASSILYFGRRSAAGVELLGSLDYGRVSYPSSKGEVINTDTTVYFKTVQAASFVYSNVIRSGPGTYEKTGFTIAPGINHAYELRVEPSPQKIIDVYDLTLSLSLFVPKLIPITCYDNYTYNLPLKLSAELFNFQNSLAAPAAAQASVLLFSYDIQKAMPGVSALFINDISIILQYQGVLGFPEINAADKNWHFLLVPDYLEHIKAGRHIYSDYATIKLSLGFTLNIGSFANPNARMNFYLAYLFGKLQNLPEHVIDFGLEAKF